jgi:protein-arginine kinase activator protein McsA
MICECCRRKEAIVKDFRNIDQELHGKFNVCKYCYNLSDGEFLKEYSKQL